MNDDLILPFSLQSANVRGKIVRLGGAISEILGRHDYPQAVSVKLGEACVLTCLLGSTLKFDGKLILQTSSDGPLNMLVADFTTPGDLRGYARFAERDGDFSNAALLGKGHLALTIDQGAHMERYQGIVALESDDLAQVADEYFERSEQIPTRIYLAAGPIITGDNASWRAGGILIQHMPGEGEVKNQAVEEGWRRVSMLLRTTATHELLDPQLPPEQLLYQLFHEEGVKVYAPHPLRAHCGCSQDRVRTMLQGFSPDERRDMLTPEGIFSVNCQFCNREYTFSAEEFD